MTMKSLLSTVSLALLLASTAATAQAQIAVGHLADYSGGTSDVGTPYGQGVADTFAWINKNGGIGGKQEMLSEDLCVLALLKLGRQYRRGRISAHSAGVGPEIALVQSLVILRRQQR